MSLEFVFRSRTQRSSVDGRKSGVPGLVGHGRAMLYTLPGIVGALDR